MEFEKCRNNSEAFWKVADYQADDIVPGRYFILNGDVVRPEIEAAIKQTQDICKASEDFLDKLAGTEYIAYTICENHRGFGTRKLIGVTYLKGKQPRGWVEVKAPCKNRKLAAYKPSRTFPELRELREDFDRLCEMLDNCDEPITLIARRYGLVNAFAPDKHDNRGFQIIGTSATGGETTTHFLIFAPYDDECPGGIKRDERLPNEDELDELEQWEFNAMACKRMTWNEIQAMRRSRFENDWISKVKVFRNVYRQPYPTAEKKWLDEQRHVVEEEYNELRKALDESGNAPSLDVLDAICDSMYVLIGLGVAHGYDLTGAFNEVQRSNMTKLGRDGQPIFREDGKILKGPDFEEPNLVPFMPKKVRNND